MPARPAAPWAPCCWFGSAASAGGGRLARWPAAPCSSSVGRCRRRRLHSASASRRRAVCGAADRLHRRGAGLAVDRRPRRLFGTDYGRIALLKLALFLALLVLAVINRFVLTDRLHARRGRSPAAVAHLAGAAKPCWARWSSWSPRFSPPARREPTRRRSGRSPGNPAWNCSTTRSAANPAAAHRGAQPDRRGAVVAGRFWRPVFWPALAAFVVTLVFVVSEPRAAADDRRLSHDVRDLADRVRR